MARKSTKSGSSRKAPKGKRSAKKSAAAPRAAKPAGAAAPSPFLKDPRLPEVGGVITKEYKGKTLRVKVTAEGLEWEGRMYRSLSKIASEAMGGASVNGFLFFGLIKRPESKGTKTASASRAKAPGAAARKGPAEASVAAGGKTFDQEQREMLAAAGITKVGAVRARGARQTARKPRR